MKFACEQSLINEALNIVSRAVPQKSPILSLEGVKLTLDKDSLELTGYDLEMGIKTKINVDSEDCGEFILNAKLFSEIIKKMPGGIIMVEINQELQTFIKGKNAEYNIIALSAEEYPSIPNCETSDKFSFSQPLLKNMIHQTIYAVSTMDNKPVLTGELFDIEDNIFNLAAIDGFRLAVRKETVQFNEKYNFVVKAKALSEVAKLLKDDDKDDKSELTIHISHKHIIFEIGEYMIISRLLEGEFHNYKGSIPEKHQTEIIINTKQISDCLERCSLLINEKTKGPVKCLFKDDTAKISCSTALGRLNEEFSVEIDGPSVEIGFNCKYLLEAIKATETDKVKLQFNGGLSPMKIVPLDGDDYVFLVLPVRLRND